MSAGIIGPEPRRRSRYNGGVRADTFARSRAFRLALALLCLSAAPLSAEQFGLFTYRVDRDTVSITDYPEDATGEVESPARSNRPQFSVSALPIWNASLLTTPMINEDIR